MRILVTGSSGHLGEGLVRVLGDRRRGDPPRRRSTSPTVNELLYRRVDLEDVVSAHRCALARAGGLGVGRYIVSATTPFSPRGPAAAALRRAGRGAAARPDCEALYAARGWRMIDTIERVYVRARAELGWAPRHDFASALAALREGRDFRSPLALAVGGKGYHAETTGPYTTRARSTSSGGDPVHPQGR
jgi:UDP-glucose 4-epimerase